MNTDKINGSASTKASDIATTTVCKGTLLALYISLELKKDTSSKSAANDLLKKNANQLPPTQTL